MTLSEREKAVALTAIGIVLVVLVGTVLYLVVTDLAIDPNASYNRGKVCQQEAHDLGYRFLDYVHPFEECWAQRPDGSIVDLFAEAEP